MSVQADVVHLVEREKDNDKLFFMLSIRGDGVL